MLLRISIAAILIVCTASLSTVDKQNGERILSRRRRYLTFPEGSSLQLVYDSLITVPDYTMYVVTGVTVALAWGLPFKPFYPDADLSEQYADGYLPLFPRNDDNITDSQYVDGVNTKKKKKKPNKTTAMSTTTPAPYQSTHQNLLELLQHVYQSQSPNYNSFSYGHSGHGGQQYQQPQYRPHNSIQYDSYSYRNNSQPRNRYYFGQSNSMAVQTPLLSSADRRFYDSTSHISDENERRPSTIKYQPNPYAEFTKYLTQTFGPSNANDTIASKKKSTKTKAKTVKSQPAEFKPIIRKLHTVFPAMGKRSIADATHENQFYLDHHRNTRHELFGLIEKYVFAKGFNGSACVLRTLCEMGQRREDEEPGSFLAEIVRAIFSLPKAQLKQVNHPRHVSYDYAHNSVDNCADEYSDCSQGIWKSGFLIELIK